MVVISCYLERESCKVLKFHKNNPSYFEITAALQQASHPKPSK